MASQEGLDLVSASILHRKGIPSRREGTIYRLSELRGLRVRRRDSGEEAGRCRDLVAIVSGDDLLVRLLVVRGAGEDASNLLPWEYVAHIEANGIQVDALARSKRVPVPSELPMRMGRDLLRRRIVDRDGKRVGTVRDVRFAIAGSELVVLELDLSLAAAIARRVGLELRESHLVRWRDVETQSLAFRPRPLRLRVTSADLTPR